MPSHPLASADQLRQFESLLDQYGAKVNQLARRFTHSESDAEDLTQEIFLDVFKALPSFRGESSPGTWIYRIALNHCLRFRDKTRKESRHRAPEMPAEETPEHGPDPAQRAAKRELSQQVHQALDQLPDHHKNVVMLHELHGLTYSECTQILDVPVGTVKSRLSNAFRALRGTLATYVLGDAEPISPPAPRRGSALNPTGGSS